MINALCVIQEGQGPDQQRDQLASVLSQFTEEHLGDSMNVNWLPVAAGSGFTAGKPSSSSVLSLTANEPLTQQRREQILRDLVSLWTQQTGAVVAAGQTFGRGDWVDGKPANAPADQANAWAKQTVVCEHELPGTARHDPLAYLQNRTVDWLDHQLAARELLDIDPAETYLVVEHEYPAARVQDKELLVPILAGSIAFTRAIDEAAAAMYALQHEVMAGQGIPIQGVGREAYRS